MIFVFFHVAGNNVRDDIVASFIALVSNTPDLQHYTMNQLLKLIRDDITQQPLVQVASWSLGEYGEQYVVNQSNHDDAQILDQSDVIDILVKVLNYNAGVLSTRQYAINALIKLSTKFHNLTKLVDFFTINVMTC